MKHKYIFHLKIYHHIYGREGGTLGCLGAGERPGDSVEDTQGLCNQAGGRSHQMRLVGPDANGRCQSVGQKIFQCCQPPATTTLPSISPPSTLPSPPFPAPARPDHSSTDHIISNSTSPSLSSAPPLSSPNMPLLGEIIVLLETIDISPLISSLLFPLSAITSPDWRSDRRGTDRRDTLRTSRTLSHSSDNCRTCR